MKKSYIKILIFEIIALIVLIANSFEASILSLYKMPIFLLALSFIFILMLGKERDNKREKNEVLFDITMGSVIFILLYYILGIVIGFAKNSFYLNIYGFSKIIIPLILTIIFKEFLRSLLLTKSGDNKLLFILTTILFIMVDLSSGLFNIFGSVQESFKYIALFVLPCISLNIFLSYCTKKVSYKVGIVFLLITNLYLYILPIIPNPIEYLKSLIDLLIPVVFLLRVRYVSNKFSIDESEFKRENRNYKLIEFSILSIFVSVLIYFVSGYFKYYAVAIASGSMEPVFNRGSVVVLEQIKDRYNNKDKLEKGSIIAFIENDTIVVHRIINIVDIDGVKYYYTKGDANNHEDGWQIEEKNIIGVVNFVIPYIGYPTVIFSEL